MKPYKPFAVRERFKGFEEPEELKGVKDEFYAEAFQRLQKKQIDFNRINSESGYDKLIKDLYWGERVVKIPSYGAILPNGISMGDPIIDEMESWPKECEHEPIDVGFTNPKMVCKKCDKDLK